MICSSVNLDAFIVRLPSATDSTQNWRSLPGSGQLDTTGSDCRLVGEPWPSCDWRPRYPCWNGLA